MSIHKNRTSESPVCYSCESFISGLSYVMQDFVLWVFKNYPNCHIEEGFRDEATQHADFLAGKSKADWKQSFHNYMEMGKPFSKAVDLFVLGIDGKAHYPIPFYQDLYSAALMASQAVRWGGNFHEFPDSVHFEADDE